jgi:hypothetical protein
MFTKRRAVVLAASIVLLAGSVSAAAGAAPGESPPAPPGPVDQCTLPVAERVGGWMCAPDPNQPLPEALDPGLAPVPGSVESQSDPDESARGAAATAAAQSQVETKGGVLAAHFPGRVPRSEWCNG